MTTKTFSIKKFGLIAIGILLFLEFILFPWFDWLKESKAELSNLKKFVYKQEALLDSKSLLTEEQAKLTNQAALFSNLPKQTEKQAPSLLWLNVVDTAIARYELEVHNKAPLREVAINDTFSVFTGQLSVSGELNTVLNLLNELENIKVGNRVRQVSLLQDPALPNKVRANIEFLRVYKQL
ncbi:hypothetical protein [Pseudoalteromonas lipolytica]|uniref:General secretion pathway protein M n=1 Tax=Pseudoalteromonas lipolytica TaxID=570156 RepID=A0ABY1GLM9_9GAMM|nr:hypothetical protein [Pseudoalteromonas lipolytica]MBE0349620.1 hypothetical protein [Pseudoalteromonas lipolytica LMEB 39]SFT78148.1 hypothetical protein SAMN04487854_109183 [Pseudoalteromonas lipolytica]